MPNAGEFIRAGDVATQGCRVTRTAVQSCADNTLVTVAFDSEIDDVYGMHSNTVNNSRITFAVAGWYEVGWQGQFILAADYIYVRYVIQLNGSEQIAQQQYAGTTANVSQKGGTSTVFWFDPGDYIEALVDQNNTANAARDLQLSGSWSPTFYAVRIGA